MTAASYGCVMRPLLLTRGTLFPSATLTSGRSQTVKALHLHYIVQIFLLVSGRLVVQRSVAKVESGLLSSASSCLVTRLDRS
jgi:hypothetical protein